MWGKHIEITSACVNCEQNRTSSLFVLHTVEWTSALILQYSEIHCLLLAAGPWRTELHREWKWSHNLETLCSGFFIQIKTHPGQIQIVLKAERVEIFIKATLINVRDNCFLFFFSKYHIILLMLPAGGRSQGDRHSDTQCVTQHPVSGQCQQQRRGHRSLLQLTHRTRQQPVSL